MNKHSELCSFTLPPYPLSLKNDYLSSPVTFNNRKTSEMSSVFVSGVGLRGLHPHEMSSALVGGPHCLFPAA